MLLYAKIPAGQPKTLQLLEIVQRDQAGGPPLAAAPSGAPSLDVVAAAEPDATLEAPGAATPPTE